MLLRYVMWATPPIIMCGSWQYGPVGFWLILIYWVIAVVNLHRLVWQYGIELSNAGASTVIAIAMTSQAVGLMWSLYGESIIGGNPRDYFWLGPTPAGVGAVTLTACAGTAEILTSLACIARKKILNQRAEIAEEGTNAGV